MQTEKEQNGITNGLWNIVSVFHFKGYAFYNFEPRRSLNKCMKYKIWSLYSTR